MKAAVVLVKAVAGSARQNPTLLGCHEEPFAPWAEGEGAHRDGFEKNRPVDTAVGGLIQGPASARVDHFGVAKVMDDRVYAIVRGRHSGAALSPRVTCVVRAVQEVAGARQHGIGIVRVDSQREDVTIDGHPLIDAAPGRPAVAAPVDLPPGAGVDVIGIARVDRQRLYELGH